ncbi:hypothetical protein L211DRAFT_869119 [Terfezia boudieri ATCC MYA-4762]|uniref:HNH nuclease domain-containing protein n=1 Tax=Terfezia boudieri ATCC MYA-4762 TaxID=1051890 RepID=A0A3N4LJD2_9PEZI|nr:hypothetical protein L211DRAFT_869119 [Terfezia boudieri ATCC MYA-4762]
MPNDHPSYPPLLPRSALLHPLRPLPHEVRLALTQRLRQRRSCEVTRGFLAALNQNLLFAAPADEQQQIMAWLRDQSESGLIQLAQTFTAAMRQWLAAGGRTAVRIQLETYRESQSTTTGLALARDNNLCVLTRQCLPQVAHIVPFSLAGPLQQTMPIIEAFLRVFVGPTVVRNLEQYLLQGHSSRNPINRVENLLCLSPNAHQCFGLGHFVLEPVGDPLAGIQIPTDVLSSYEVRFSWISENRPGASARGRSGSQQDLWDLTQVLDPGVPMSEDSDPELPFMGLFRLIPQPSGRPPLPRRLRTKFLETGFIFTLTTDDPVHHPLPHPDLLVLHAAVMRACRAAGLSAPEDDEDWDFPEDVDLQSTIQEQLPPEDPSYTLRRFLEADEGMF